MAYGLIYNLNFASKIKSRKHRLSIYKDGHTATITTSDNNLIGADEPVVLIWDNSDDIYNNIMGSRLEMNFYSDPVKQIDVDDILDNTTPSKFKVEFWIENFSGAMVLYWTGYLSNATYEQRISSTPVQYQLIATDLAATLKNVYAANSTAIIDSKGSVVKYFANVFGNLPTSSGFKFSNDIQLKPYKFGQTNVFEKMHQLPWLLPYKNGFEYLGETADDYLTNTMKVFNSRLFFAQDYWYVINNCSYKDNATFDNYANDGTFLSSAPISNVKVIPTNLKPLKNDFSIRYDTPIDIIEITANKNHITTDFVDVGLVETETNNITSYGGFETQINGILGSAYYSNDFSVIQESKVKTGNIAVKTNTFITSGTPTTKVFDTGFTGDFQWEAADTLYFYASFFIEYAETMDVTLYYSLLKEQSSSSTGNLPTNYYYNGSSWTAYTNESLATKLTLNATQVDSQQWVDVSEPLTISGSNLFARYRLILWSPKITGGIANNVIHFDQVFVGRRSSIAWESPIKTIHSISGSARKNKSINYEYHHFYPVAFGTEFQTSDITFSGVVGWEQHNRLIAQQILNDNRKHIKRYSTTAYSADFDEILFPYHKINVNFNGYQSTENCIIDRLTYSAKSGIYEIEFHETNQATNVNMSTTLVGST